MKDYFTNKLVFLTLVQVQDATNNQMHHDHKITLFACYNYVKAKRMVARISN